MVGHLGKEGVPPITSIKSSLTLLMASVFADHTYHTFATDDFAFVTTGADRRPYLHTVVLSVPLFEAVCDASTSQIVR